VKWCPSIRAAFFGVCTNEEKEEKYERFVITRLQRNTYIFSASLCVLLKICARVHVYVSVLRVNFQLENQRDRADADVYR